MAIVISKNQELMHAHIGPFDWRNIFRIDWTLLFLAAALLGMGMLVLLSAAHSGSVAPTGGLIRQGIALFFNRNVMLQSVAILLGAGLAFGIICLDYRLLVSWAPVVYILSLGLLGLVFVPGLGHEAKGGQRWIGVGSIHFQPSEFAKFALICALAWYFTLLGPRIRKLPFFLLTFAIPVVPAVLILKQPNLGTTLTLIPIVFAMLFVAGCRWWHLVALCLIGLAAIPVGWTQLKDYQKERVVSFGKQIGLVKTSEDEEERARLKELARGSGYHTLQTKITVGSGQMHGKGYLRGTQTHLSFLPEHHTDFIFAVLAEEMGFVGAITALGLFLLFFLRGLSLARDCPQATGMLLAVGCVTVLAFHVFVNIAITIGLMPVTGIPLPFFSYGPSFCLITMMIVGTMLSVHVHRKYFD